MEIKNLSPITTSQNGKQTKEKSNLTNTSQNGKRSRASSTNAPIQSSQLMKLFEDELKDIYWAEKALTKAIPKMIKNAKSKELIDALKSHLGETENQVTRLAQVFESIGKKAIAKKCEAMEGLIKEAGEIMESCESGAMCDAGIISAGRKIEHYEIASYGTLCAFAKALGESEALAMLRQTLDEEKNADEKLSEMVQLLKVETGHEDKSEYAIESLDATKAKRK